MAKQSTIKIYSGGRLAKERQYASLVADCVCMHLTQVTLKCRKP
jgi:hypothetical protein